MNYYTAVRNVPPTIAMGQQHPFSDVRATSAFAPLATKQMG